jgi:hypothetical protein
MELEGVCDVCVAAVLLTYYVCVGFYIGGPCKNVINIIPYLFIFLFFY